MLAVREAACNSSHQVTGKPSYASILLIQDPGTVYVKHGIEKGLKKLYSLSKPEATKKKKKKMNSWVGNQND